MGELTGTSGMMSQPDLWGTGLKTFAMLCIVVAILILVLFLMKRFFYLKNGSGHGQFIKILSSHHLSPKQRVALIDVVGEKNRDWHYSGEHNFLDQDRKIRGPKQN